MYNKNLIIAGSIALSLHAALIVISPNVTSEPKVIFRKGESSLKMNLIPSVASTASIKSFDNIKEEVQKVEEKKIENPEPVKKPEVPKKEQIKVEEKIVQEIIKIAEQENQEITHSAEYFKTGKDEVDIKKLQIQERKAATQDSKEIIADVKVKGVTTGAIIKNVFKPSYPSSCKRQGHEGTTVLEVTILSKGKCGSIEIIKSAGCESLDKAAIKALKRAKYISAKRLGVPFTTTKKIAFNFRLEDYQ